MKNGLSIDVFNSSFGYVEDGEFDTYLSDSLFHTDCKNSPNSPKECPKLEVSTSYYSPNSPLSTDVSTVIYPKFKYALSHFKYTCIWVPLLAFCWLELVIFSRFFNSEIFATLPLYFIM